MLLAIASLLAGSTLGAFATALLSAGSYDRGYRDGRACRAATSPPPAKKAG